MGSLITELKRRKVFRVAAVYAVVAWLLIQVADVVLPTFGAPGWVNQTLIFLFILGFPIAVVLAWAYEVTPAGVKPDTGTASTAIPKAQNQGLLYATFALVLLVAGFQVADRFLAAQSNGINVVEGAAVSTGNGPVIRVAVQLRDEEFFHDSRGDFDLSPDGSFFVYLGSDEAGGPLLWQRRWDSLRGRPLANTNSATRPRISPDGTEVLFPASGQIKVLTLGSGQVRTLLQSTNTLNLVPDWSTDGSWIYFVNESLGISRIPSTGGAQEELVKLNPDNGDERFSFMEPLPGSNMLFTVRGTDGVTRIRGQDAASGQLKDLVEGDYPRYTPSGYLLYQDQENARLLAAPFDPDALEFLGPPVQIDDGLLLVGGGGVGNVGVSDTGRLIYRKGDASGRLATPVWVDRNGLIADVEPNWQMISQGGRGIATLSPDDEAISVAIGNDIITADIWVNQLDGPMTRITFGEQSLYLPRWSADGESIYYGRNDGPGWSISIKRADGSGFPQTLVESNELIRDSVFSSDGRWLVFRDLPTGDFSGRLRALEIGSGSDPITLIGGDHENTSPALSPDGRWLAYVSDESGQYEVYVRPFPDVDAGRWQISVNGGTEPLWAHSGRELFYRNGNDELVVVDVRDGTGFQWGQERVLFDASPFRNSAGQVTTYSITSDDQRFLMMRMDRVIDTELIMVDNWTAGLVR